MILIFTTTRDGFAYTYRFEHLGDAMAAVPKIRRYRNITLVMNQRSIIEPLPMLFTKRYFEAQTGLVIDKDGIVRSGGEICPGSPF